MAIKVPVGYDTDGAQLDRDMTSDVSKAGGKAGAAGGKATSKSFSSSFRSGIKDVLAGLGLAAGLSEAKQFLGDSLAEAREAQKVGAATDLLVRKLGKSAGVTSKSIGDLSNSISKNVGLDDELIQTGANVLLGFKNIRNEVGKGNAVFDRATAAAVDLSATPLFKGNLTAASKALGKALADPEKGLTALGRVGIKFNAQQTERIKNYAKEGDALSAQKIILKEVESRYKGTAASQATASDKARVAIDNLKEEIGTALLPVVDDLARFTANKAVPAISDFIKEFQNGTGPAGDIRDVLEDVGDVLGDVAKIGKDVAGFFNGLPGPVKKTAVQLGIALIAMRGVNSIMGSIGGSGAANLVRGLANTETRLATTTTASQKLGAGLRAAGGAAGALALTKSLNETNTGLQFLERTAGGALVGLAAAGPIGAAVGGGLGILSLAFQGTGEKAKEATPKFSDYASSLDDVSGASNRATAALVKQDLAENHTLENAGKLGISERLLVRGVANLGGAREKLIGVLRAQSQAADTQFETDKKALLQEKIGGAIYRQKLGLLEETRDKTKGLVSATLQNIGVVDKERLSYLDNQITLAGTKEELKKARQAKADYVNQNGVATIGLKGAPKAREAIEGVKGALGEIVRSWEPTIDAKSIRAAQRTLNTFIRSLGSLKGGNATPDIGNLPIPGKESGGPVRRGVPYIVGERRPEVFVPNQSGRIVPSVQQYASSVPQASVPAPSLTIIQNDYGPRTGFAKVQEIAWATRYSTHARGYQGAS